jgi:hypothetical protein
MTAEQLAAARAYIGRGWPVFMTKHGKIPVGNCDPCREQHTTPEQMEACPHLSCHGFYAATLDIDRAAQMIRRNPRGCLSIRTGAPSGTVVIDVDAPDGLPTMRALMAGGTLPRTLAQRSGGGGFHLVYGHPGVRIPTVPGKGGKGIDIKADGGCLVVAPSLHSRTGCRYEWAAEYAVTPLPDVWTERLREPERRPRSAVTRLPDPSKATRYAQAALRGEVQNVLDSPDAEHNHALFRAAFKVGQLIVAGVLDEDEAAEALADAAEQVGQLPGETRRTIMSGFRAGGSSPRQGAA